MDIKTKEKNNMKILVKETNVVFDVKSILNETDGRL